MLSDTSAATVRATLPAVGAAIGDISELFYRRLFAAHPALLRDLFNRGNQAAGTQRQALAGAFAAFAGHLVEHPDARPDAMLRRIAHKHASLGVSPDQYPLVREHLFAAIAEVLGEAVTPQVAAAWDEVYWLMANALIALERELYAGHGLPAGGSWQSWEVLERTRETTDVTSFLLRPADGARLLPFRPGQYVSVQVELADGARQIRQYSLSGAPDDSTRRIGVKRERGRGGPDGEVSAHLHDRVRPGDLLRVSAPYGDLVLDEDAGRPLLLASAGIGVTPMLSMLHALAARGHRAPVTVVHGDRSPASHALSGEHAALTGKLPLGRAHFFYEELPPHAGSQGPGVPGTEAAADGTGPQDGPIVRAGLVDLTGLDLAPGTRAYLCGPLEFMRAVRSALLAGGLPAAEIHYEVFGPDLWLARG